MQHTDFFVKVKTALDKYIQSENPLYGWELIQSRKKSTQRLYEGKDHCKILSHQDREVDETSYSLTVYCQLDDPESLGMATSTLYPYNDIDNAIHETLTLALNSKNKKWVLLEKQTDSYPPVITYDERIKSAPLAVIADIEQAVEAELKKYGAISVNSAECFVNYENILRQTHTGIITYKEKSDIYFEIAMERRGQNNDKEVHEYLKSVRYQDMDIARFIQDCVLQVESLGHTVEPETTQSATILADVSVIAPLLSALVSQLNAANEYHHLPYLKMDDLVYRDKKGEGSDRLSIELDPFVDGYTQSGGYTSEGMIAQKALVIENDRVRNRQVSQRYGQYLGLEPRGIMGNMRVTPGTVSAPALRKQAGAYYEIVKLSSLLVNERNLTWSSEIKLAKYYDIEGKLSLIKGGVISGSIPENLSDFSFSSETDTLNSPASSYDAPMGYLGPKYILIRKGVSIAGL